MLEVTAFFEKRKSWFMGDEQHHMNPRGLPERAVATADQKSTNSPMATGYGDGILSASDDDERPRSLDQR
ncbi:hypothetical protein E2562_030687 [Oryza meyeriana var. granulata]|uniref:Uncharacterized protein n=1 Tax=Oryza meyeriana var. granulata TaxID=110450 RepID=A0A6G1DQY0_9ORYZ|nr:hypothetical protein E2562_030687 [Oryza meyeriana var. granulata]